METVGRLPCKSQFAKTHQKKHTFTLRPAPTVTENFYQTPLVVQRRPDDHFHSYPPLFSLPPPPPPQQQPPLLPLPLPHTRIQNPNPNPNPRVMMRSLSCQPSTTYRKNRNDSVITPKKYSAANSKQISKNLKKATEKDIDEQVTKMYNSSISGNRTTVKSVNDAAKKEEEDTKVVDFLGSPFTLVQVQSPPPSSLPLPTFTLRPKPHIRSC